MKLEAYLKKSQYILKEEGLRIFLKRSFNYLTYATYRFVTPNKADIERWGGLKDQYKGKRAFIIGNGPSINKTPLYLLKDEFTICFNRFDLMLERLSWNPTAYCTIDDIVLEDNIQIAKKMSQVSKYAFFPDIHPSSGIRPNFKRLIGNSGNIYWLHLSDFGFTNQLPRCGINKTVANVAVQILTYMGFSEIYFIGVDLDYSIPDTLIKSNNRTVMGGEDDDPNHFDPRYFGKGKKYHMPRMTETFEKFQEAAKFLHSNGVKAYNAGIGGKLEVFPRVDINKIIPRNELERLRMMVGHIVPDIASDSLKSIFPHAVVIKDLTEWDDAAGELIASVSLANEIISKKIFEFAPFGPYKDLYLFLKRSKYFN